MFYLSEKYINDSMKHINKEKENRRKGKRVEGRGERGGRGGREEREEDRGK